MGLSVLSSQSRHTQKPLIGIGAKLFDGAQRNFAVAGVQVSTTELSRNDLHLTILMSIVRLANVCPVSADDMVAVCPYPPLACPGPMTRLKVTAVNMWWLVVTGSSEGRP